MDRRSFLKTTAVAAFSVATLPAISLRANADKLGLRPDIRQTSALALGSAPAPLDLIMMDPPYGTGAGLVALDKLARLGWTSPATW